MLNHYLAFLVDAIRRHELIRKHAQLRSKQWTKSCFDIASDLIAAQLDRQLSAGEKLRMGTTISPKTLSNLFKGEYKLAYPIDPRSLNTLTKLTRFLGIASWEDFMEQADEKRLQKAASDNPAEASAFALREAIAAEFRAYAALPAVEPGSLSAQVEPGSPAFNRIMDALLHFQGQNWQVSNPYNPSTFEVLDFEMLSADDSLARFRTREYWLLCWWDAAANRYVRRHKEIQEHFYTLTQTPEGWRVKTNASLADFADNGGSNGSEVDVNETVAGNGIEVKVSQVIAGKGKSKRGKKAALTTT